MNPLERIRKIVEIYHWKKDVEAARKSKCTYIKISSFKDEEYKIDERLKEFGRFTNTNHRRLFLYAMLETDKYEKECKNCGEKVTNLSKHGMEECQGVEHDRKVFKLRMRLYNAQVSKMNISKTEVFDAALKKKCLMKVLCDFLSVIWNRHGDG